MNGQEPLRIAVVGGGAAGLAASWLLTRGVTNPNGSEEAHHVTLIEKDDRLGGHAHTASVKCDTNPTDAADHVSVDTGFIVYNELNYPNLTAWLKELGVESQASTMSFSVSRDGGRFEYKGGDMPGLLAQPGNILKPRFWRMLTDLIRFYRQTSISTLPAPDVTLGAFLSAGGYGQHFINDHLLPFGAAIWSTSQQNMLNYPAAAFIRFCDNHGLLKLSGRPAWRTITGGSNQYVNAVCEQLESQTVLLNKNIMAIRRLPNRVELRYQGGETDVFDHVVLATHADQALALLDDPDEQETRLLKAFKYDQNLAILHSDTELLPKRRRAWASWNYMDTGVGDMRSKASVSYWMNCLQSLPGDTNYIVSLNPSVLPDTDKIIKTNVYDHPIFTLETWQAQQQLWGLQGGRNTWFCGAYFGSGFHEDAIQSGLAVAEQLGHCQRPWTVSDESGRIVMQPVREHHVEGLVA